MSGFSETDRVNAAQSLGAGAYFHSRMQALLGRLSDGKIGIFSQLLTSYLAGYFFLETGDVEYVSLKHGKGVS